MLRTRSVMYIVSLLATARWLAVPAASLPVPLSFLRSSVSGDREKVTVQTIPPFLGSYHIHRGHQTFHLTISSHFLPSSLLLRSQ